MKKLLIGLLVVGLMMGPAFAHPGGTDSKGGHTNRSTGEYHYHHGYSAHDHVDGVCPYDYDDKTGERSGSSGSSSSYSYTAVAVAEDWYDEYVEAQEARRAAEKELEEIKSNQLRNLALSAIVGLCGGLSTLIVQIRRSHKRLEETERRLLEQAERDVQRAKQSADVEWRSRVNKVASERDNAIFQKQEVLKALVDEKCRVDNAIVSVEGEKRRFIAKLEREKRDEEEKRRQNSIMFSKMAQNAVNSEHSLAYAERVVLNTTTVDVPDGVVYVPANLNTHVYHREYLPCGIQNMVLASKKNVIAQGLTQCPLCDHAAQPIGDLLVMASPSGTKVYHSAGAHCAGYTAKEIRLSEAKKRGLKPCSKCFPPTENPKVWF